MSKHFWTFHVLELNEHEKVTLTDRRIIQSTSIAK